MKFLIIAAGQSILGLTLIEQNYPHILLLISKEGLPIVPQ